jgi:PAS domain S-box-containing protein
MPTLELILVGALGAFVALGLWALRRPGLGPLPFWIAGWVVAGLAGIPVIAAGELRLLQLMTFPFGTLFPWLLLAGALEFAGRRTPVWMLPFALVFGLSRSVVAAAGHSELAYAMALPLEPLVTVAAGWIAHRAAFRDGSGLSRRLLGPSFVGLALVGSFHVVWLLRGLDPDPVLTLLWIVVIPPVLGLHVYAASERTRGLLARSNDELEHRIAERTCELAQANTALRLSEERYRTVSELSSDFSFAFDLDAELNLTIEWMTGAFERITGADPSVLSGRGWLEFLPPQQQRVVSAVMRAARPGERASREIPLRALDGSEHWIELRAYTEESDSPGALRVVGAGREVTDRRRLEAERRKLERSTYASERLESLGRLSGGIAHDFNNLLSVILGNAALAEDDLGDEAGLRTRLSRIRSAADHAARLTEQMLAYAGKAQTTRSVVDASAAVEQLLDLVRATLPQDCAFDASLTPGLWIEAEVVQIQQVVMNLVTNAIEALEGGRGRVGLRVAALAELPADLEGAEGAPEPRSGPYVVIEVQDDGRGMDASTREQVFEPFFSTKFTGRGMGLASTLGIVRAHGGVAVFESAPARGTTARVFLPRVDAQEARPARAEQVSSAAQVRGRILVVDDDPDVLEVAAEFLRRDGFEVLCAVGGREGVERVQEEQEAIDAVLLDLSMPGLGGEQAFLAMRQIRPDLPIVLATGFSEALGSDRFRAPGASGFVRKPFDQESLVASVVAALGES